MNYIEERQKSIRYPHLYNSSITFLPYPLQQVFLQLQMNLKQVEDIFH